MNRPIEPAGENKPAMLPVPDGAGGDGGAGRDDRSALGFAVWAVIVAALPLFVLCAAVLGVAFAIGCPLLVGCPLFGWWR